MIEGANVPSDIVLVYSAQSAHDFPLKSEIDRLSRRKNLKVHYVLTAEERSDMHSGRIDFDFLHRHVPDVAQRVAFICGPAAMNRDVESALQRLGVSPGNIHIERFSL